MSLSSSSALHYWTARYGSVPVVGGKPVHSRSSAAAWIDQQGVLQSAVPNTPRMEWADFGDGAGRRQVMRLEQSRTNNVPWSVDASNGAWSTRTLTVTTGILDPTGGLNACTLTATATDSEIWQHLANGSSVVRTNSIWLRRRTGSGSILFFNPLDTSPSTLALTSQWQRFSITGGASALRWWDLVIHVSGDAVDFYNAQQEDGATASTDIVNVGATPSSRSADSFYWNFPPLPQALMVYARWIDDAGFLGSVLNFGNAAGSNPELAILNSGSRYEAYQNGVTSLPASTPAAGQTVEYVLAMDAGGSVTGIQSLNGGAVASGAPSGGSTPPTAWPDTKLWINSEGTLSPGLRRWGEVKVVVYADVVAITAQGIMDELRAFELGPNGIQL